MRPGGAGWVAATCSTESVSAPGSEACFHRAVCRSGRGEELAGWGPQEKIGLWGLGVGRGRRGDLRICSRGGRGEDRADREDRQQKTIGGWGGIVLRWADGPNGTQGGHACSGQKGLRDGGSEQL